MGRYFMISRADASSNKKRREYLLSQKKKKKPKLSRALPRIITDEKAIPTTQSKNRKGYFTSKPKKRIKLSTDNYFDAFKQSPPIDLKYKTKKKLQNSELLISLKSRKRNRKSLLSGSMGDKYALRMEYQSRKTKLKPIKIDLDDMDNNMEEEKTVPLPKSKSNNKKSKKKKTHRKNFSLRKSPDSIRGDHHPRKLANITRGKMSRSEISIPDDSPSNNNTNNTK